MLHRTLLLAALALTAAPALAADTTPPAWHNLKYRLAGPWTGGRLCAVAGVPGDRLTAYGATASGGVWKTTDGGLVWESITDDLPDSSFGAVAVAPSDPAVVYAGAGEANVRGNVAVGHGIYRSTDAGKHWDHVWKGRGQVGRILVHPRDPDTAYAAVLGSPFASGAERGVFRTRDGGKTWRKVLFKDADTGAIDLAFDPTNPRLILAALWQCRRQPWEFTSGGPGSGLHLSRDGGDTWEELKPADEKGKRTGLPDGPYGRIGLAWAPSDRRRVYALIEAGEPGLYRSDDGGESWARISEDRSVLQRPWYFSTLTVDPKNADVVYAPQVRLQRSTDGGKTFHEVKGPVHGDHHSVWIDPADPRHLLTAHDAGIDVSPDGGETWRACPLPLAQFYHVAADSAVPYRVMGNMQDVGTAAAPSDSLNRAGITLGDWQHVGGGETGFTVPDPADPDTIYAGEYGGYLSRWDRKTRQAVNVSPRPVNPSGVTPAEMKFRFQWTAPIVVSRHRKGRVYHGANVVFRSEDRGRSWQAISGDLTRNDKSKQKWSGGPITGDNTGVEIYGTVFALAEAPLAPAGGPPLLWAGTDDGRVHVSRDDGKTWDNVTANAPGLPEWGTVACIEPSRHDALTAWLIVDRHRLDDDRPYLWRTTDGGKTWAALAGKLPVDVHLHAVREDPTRKGLLFLGTQRGVMFSVDAGDTWVELRLNLPTVPVHDLAVTPGDLVVGTHGRSIWILDDLSPLRADPKVLAGETHLFEPAAAVRWREDGPVSKLTTRYAGKNPPRGAILHYYFKEKPKGPFALEISDSAGKLVRRFESSDKPDGSAVGGEDDEDEEDEADPEGPKERVVKVPAKAGVNRFAWDLRYPGARIIPGAKFDLGDPRAGPLVPPGDYRVTLVVGEKKQTVPLKVQPDPRQAAGDPQLAADLAELAKLALEVRDGVSGVAASVLRLRAIRKQLLDHADLLQDEPKAKGLLEQGKAIADSLDALEDRYHNPKAKVSYDIFARPGGAKLYSQLSFLLETLNSSDNRPTEPVREAAAEFLAELKKLDGELAGALKRLAAYNEAARKLQLPPVYVPAAGSAP